MVKFSVLMPTYNQAFYIRRAIKSLYSQTYQNWELILINDGCTDQTEEYIAEYLADHRIQYIKNEINEGLGYALNQGLDMAQYEYIAYLPSDDYYYKNHLEVLSKEFEKSESIVLAYTAAASGTSDSLVKNVKTSINGLFCNYSLQLVQTSHKKTVDRWVVRNEWVSEDLFQMFWNKLVAYGLFTSIKEITCEWTDHSFQRHKLISENYGGGLNIYRKYYDVKKPIKLKVSGLKFIDEEQLYKNYRKPFVKSNDCLKILIVGELAYNPERIYAFEEAGHQLFGLWTKEPSFSFDTVGPLPFGNVIDVPYDSWRSRIKEIEPDIIYATLNFGVVPLAFEVLNEFPEIPFVWHFKEGPSICRYNATWEKLLYLYANADGKIYINSEMKDWYECFIPQTNLSFILDGDLPKKECFTSDFSPRISEQDGEIHTVIPGRIIGIGINEINILSQNKIHTHLYIESYHVEKLPFIRQALKIAPRHFHVHPHCSCDKWVSEFSKYDAGWLHCFNSKNQMNLMNAGWDDLNIPARINTLAAAGLPMIQKNNEKHIVAMQSCIKNRDMGIFFNTMTDLIDQLHDKELLNVLRGNVLFQRDFFTFDYHIPELIAFFRDVIELKMKKRKMNSLCVAR